MSFSATLTMVMSMSAMRAAPMTTTVMPALWPTMVPRSMLLDDRDAGAHPGAEGHAARHAIEPHQHGDALHHLGEVAGGVVGRKQREARARPRGEAVHVTDDGDAAVGVDLDVGALAGANLGDLVLLEVGHDPHVVERGDGEERARRVDGLAGLDGAARHHARDGRA